MSPFQLSFRNFIKHKPYSFLNLLGLSIGLCITFIALLYVNEETGYDTFNEKFKEIYRVLNIPSSDNQITQAYTNVRLAKEFQEQIPEIENIFSYRGARIIIDEIVENDGVYYASPSIVDILTFDLVNGDFDTFKDDPSTIIISEKFALKYMNDVFVSGRTMFLDKGDGKKKSYVIGAVFKNFPKKSSIIPHIILSAENSTSYLRQFEPQGIGVASFEAYLLLNVKASVENVVEKLNKVANSLLPENFEYEYQLQAIEKVHLYSDEIRSNYNYGGSYKKVMVYSSIGILVLIISLMNYLLLYSAISKRRLKEIAIRKINGFGQWGILKMFLTESLMIGLTAATIALLLLKFAVPLFNDFTNSILEVNFLKNFEFMAYSVFIVVLVSMISGAYFTYYINKSDIIKVLHKKRIKPSPNFLIDNGTILVQAIIVSFMLIFSLSYYKQIDFMLNTDKGYNDENLFLISGFGFDHDVFQREMTKHSSIESVTWAIYCR